MSSPSLFALLSRALRRRHAFPRWLPALALALAGLLGSSAAQATVYYFTGSPVATCTLSGTVYTCPYPAYLDADDAVVIGAGYTLKVTTSVTVTYNQGLTMQAGSRLIVTGNLNINGIAPANLVVADGSFIDVGGTFSMGDLPQSLSADIKANAIHLGTDRVTINGNLTSNTSIAIGSYASISGDIRAATVTTAAPVTITGNVIASTSFSLASGSKVSGNVDTGSLVLESSEALITGSAYVTTARLEWHGRVAGTIYCKNGTAKGKCDCVTNNSGYEVNKVNGPTCESAPAELHHFQITHDGSGDTCVPEAIKVVACANEACTMFYTKGVSGKLSPFGTDFAIANGQSAVTVSATQIGTGSFTLDVTGSSVAPETARTCYQSSARSGSCAIAFAGGVKLLMDVPDHQAGASGIAAAISAVKANDQANKCVPVFANATYTVKYACSYTRPASGTEPVTLNGTNLSCGAPAQGLATTFINGVASLPLKYLDAGEVTLNGTLDDGRGTLISGSTAFVAAPARFALTPATGPLRAGADFDLTVQALNVANAVTKNFDTARLNSAGGTQHAVALDVDCRAQAGAPGLFAVGSVAFANGAATVKANWTEVGRIDVKATLTDFLGSSFDASGSTDAATSGCTGKAGPFIPQYFRVELAETGIQAGRGFYYSKEPFTLRVSAMSRKNTLTENYSSALGLSEAVTLAANASTGAAFAPAPGALSGGAIPATGFAGGVATIKPKYSFSALTKPTRIRLRASNGKTGASDVSSNYGGAAEAAETNAMPEVRNGRLRIANAFGGRGGSLALPVMAEYWTGSSWMVNTDDDYTTLPVSAFTIRSTRQPGSAAAATPFQVGKVSSGSLVLGKGVKSFVVNEASGGAGWGDVTVNLGAASPGVSCLGSVANPNPASMDWLRSANACDTSQLLDPSARATFGVFALETKRVIHVREVFR